MRYRVKELRTKAGLTQEALAKQAGVSRPVISKMETNDAAIVSLRTLSRIANALDVTIGELYCAI